MAETSKPEARAITTGALLFGTPIAYIAIWAAILAVTGAIPFSFVVGGAGSFPIALGLLGTTAAAIGPVAGFIACIIGREINTFLTPWTTGNPLGPIYDAISVFAVGLLLQKDIRLRIVGYLMGVASYCFSASTFIITGLGLTPEGAIRWFDIFLPGSTDALIGLILALTAFTPYMRRFLQSENPLLMAFAILSITYFSFSIQHMIGWGVFTIQYLYPLDGSIYIAFYFTWWERAFLAATGTFMGTAILYAIRKVGLQKPAMAVY
ncbi:MAG: hypothetical protein ACTSYO_07825 [Candidatus Ranarchaeia archaeon]